MIRIRKPPAPNVLEMRGRRESAKLCDTHDSSEPHRRGSVAFKFKSDLYGHDDVRTALLKAQAGKCAFCESRFDHIDYGDVEHFRPKGAFRQKHDDSLVQPGYYWLAYEWDNLFLSCTLCNQKFKANLFPLANPKRRARSHSDDVALERPMLLHPGDDAIEDHITFVGEMPVAVKGSRRGAKTIEVLGLDRVELNEERLRVRTILKLMIESREKLLLHPPPVPAEIRKSIAEIDQFLEQSANASAHYSAMARVLLT